MAHQSAFFQKPEKAVSFHNLVACFLLLGATGQACAVQGFLKTGRMPEIIRRVRMKTNVDKPESALQKPQMFYFVRTAMQRLL